MQKSITILNELREISPALAEINVEIPYKVPQRYFEGLAAQIMLKIATKENEAVDPVLTINKENIYKVPQGYFEGLAAQVMLGIATKEKEATDPILTINKENIYQVPQGYFETLAATIINKIKATETTDVKEELELLSPVLGQIEKKNPYSSPSGYFNEFSENVVAGVQAIEFVNTELENLSPVMSNLKEKNVYEVPQGYFENLPLEILNKTKHQPAKVVSISFAKIIRYAAAAVVISVIAIGSYLNFKPAAINTVAATGEIPSFAKMSDQEIENYANNNTVSLADANTVTAGDINENDGKDLLADVSDEELQQYLEQHAGTANSITN